MQGNHLGHVPCIKNDINKDSPKNGFPFIGFGDITSLSPSFPFKGKRERYSRIPGNMFPPNVAPKSLKQGLFKGGPILFESLFRDSYPFLKVLTGNL